MRMSGCAAVLFLSGAFCMDSRNSRSTMGSWSLLASFETVRPGSRPDGSREELAARPENLRLLLAEYQGITAGDEVDFVGGVLELLGFDPETACWAGKQEISSGQYQYVWVPERNFSQFMLS